MNDEQDTLERLQLRREVDPETGIIYWFNSEGRVHREHGPAVEYPDGSKLWMQDGVWTRGTYSDGTEMIKYK